MEQKEDVDIQAEKRDCKAPLTRYFSIRKCGRQADLSVKVGVAKN